MGLHNHHYVSNVPAATKDQMRLVIAIAVPLLLTLCGGAPSPAQNAPASLQLPVLTIRRNVRVYELTGKTITDIVSEYRVMAKTGQAPPALAQTIWAFTIDMARGAGRKTSCSSDPISIAVTLTTVLPHAVNSSQFSLADSVQWHAFLPALTRHETRHESVVVAETSAFLRQIETERRNNAPIKSVPQCVDALSDRLGRASTNLDEVTRHGETDGAILVVPTVRR